jgi:hypothetical protein
VLRLVVVLAAVVVAVSGIRLFLKEPRSSVPREVAVPSGVSRVETTAVRTAAAERINEAPRKRIPPTSSTEAPSTPPAVAPATVPPPDTSTPHTRELVGRLAQVDVSSGKISAEQVGQWKQGLRDLATQGSAAVSAIRQFLAQNQDLSFGEIEGGNAVGYTSVRAGLFDVLKQIGGPDATEAFLQTLHTTADPAEIALLARTLEEQGSGEYRPQVLNAAREVLEQASTGKLTVKEVGPLFQVLQQYGDASVVANLERTIPQWQYYGIMALAGMPSGEGIPTLIQQAAQPEASGARTFALQMLAQVSAQYPEAAATLLEQARLDRIPIGAWHSIATGLATDQYQMANPQTDPATSGAAIIGLKGYHIQAGNQNYYSLPLATDRESDELNQRRKLIDQLLAVTRNPVALEVLQKARAQLAPTQPAN